tara:strand:- start:327 stop:545 length:219 start_codon:yes stop_codon:yes gene_type:complete
MIHQEYRITCDNCNKREYSDGHVKQLELKDDAKGVGWTQRKVPNGAVWDLCPKCSSAGDDGDFKPEPDTDES